MGTHVVVGTGQVGSALARLLAAEGHDVVAASRSGNGPAEVGTKRVNAADVDSLIAVAQGADVIYNCVNPPYNRWQQDWPPMAEAFIQAAEKTGAVLVTLGNLYGYGEVDKPMTEDLPLAASGAKGRVRARMWNDALDAHRAGRIRATEVRASDYFGPGTTDQAFVGHTRFLRPIIEGKRIPYMHDLDMPHSWTYVPDAAHALAVAGTDERAWGRPWHAPTGPPKTARELATAFATTADAPTPRLSRVPYWLSDTVSIASPVLREMRETRHQFTGPFTLDSSDFETTFGVQPTPFAQAVDATVADSISRLAKS
jgi:nucleoside-diphosphate-sugar epimerase